MLGSYDANPDLALAIGLGGIAGLLALNAAITWFSLHRKRATQRLLGSVLDPMERLLTTSSPSRQTYRPRDISAFHRVNGYPPPDPDYQRMAAGGFTDYRLSVEGLVARPLSLSLTELCELGWQTQITKHNCIQGWTAVAQWAGVPLLGFKMVKWIRSIELVSDYRQLGQGHGGWREDQQYYTTWAGI